MNTISIIDYGMSNLLSITRGFEKIGSKVTIISDPESILAADKLVLPGVGAFPDGMRELHKRQLIEPIRKHTKSGKPFLGICLGMQMMLTKGYEITETEGLDLIKGEVVKLPNINKNSTLNKLPHMNWNIIKKTNNVGWINTILENNISGDYMYFVHSYFAKIENLENQLAYTPFGDINFTSAIVMDNCFGTQFHPEKSGEIGLKILKTFSNLKNK